MLKAKRVMIASLCGLLFGLICMTLASSNPEQPLGSVMRWAIIISRLMMGFTIGISALRLKWWLHGIVLGAVASIPMAVPVMDQMSIAIGTVVMGIIYGLLTELITSVLFKAKSPFVS